MKKCFKCERVLPLSDYYKHPMMADGHLGKCKDCTKKDTAARVREKQRDPEWVIAEAKRNRLKMRKIRSLGLEAKPSKKARKAALEKWNDKHPQKYAAHIALGNAVRDGVIKKTPCSVCNSPDSEGHHDDYSKPLEVIWLCPKHHAERHVALRDEQRTIRALAKKNGFFA